MHKFTSKPPDLFRRRIKELLDHCEGVVNNGGEYILD